MSRMTTSCARLGVDAQLACGGRRVSRRARASRSASSNRSGLRGAMTSSAFGIDARIAEEGFEHRLLFALERAGGDDHRAVGADAEIAQHAVAAAIGRADRRRTGRRSGNSSESNFRRPVTDTRSRGGADVDDPARRLVALHAEAIDVREHAAEERADEPVARIRARRDPAVDERRLDAGALAGAQQVRPDLGLHHDEQPRLDQPQRAFDDEAEVEREVEDLVDVLQVASRRSAARSSSSSTGRAAAAGSARAARAAARARSAPRRPTPRGSRSISSPSRLNDTGR